jgi:hypothetical protein
MMRHFAALLAVVLALSPTLPAQAVTVQTADFKPGSTIAVGLPGLAYDHGFGNLSLGAVIGDTSLGIMNNRIKLGARGVYRFFEIEGLSTGLVAGLTYDPGTPGQRAYMVPDVGLSMAYHVPGSQVISLRVNMTVTANQYNAIDYGSVPADYVPPSSNILQRLTFGPNTTVGLGIRLTEHLEASLGGGTLVGLRLNF